MTTILTTTGISLHINTKRECKTNQPTDDQMREYLYRDPTSASAEANSLLQIAQPSDSIILLHTDTPEAKQCANLIREFFLEKRGYKPYQVQVKKLQLRDDEKHIETHGLRNLVNEIDQILRDNSDVVINATTGFKLETIYSTIVGMLHQVPIKYLHEKFRRIVTLNPVALDWDMSLFFNDSVFFEWLDKPKPQREVEERLLNSFERQRIETLLTPPDDNGNISLSPLGETLQLKFMYEADAAEKADWPPEVQVKNIEEKIASSIINQGHAYPKWTKDTCKKIAHIPYVQIIIPEHFANVSRSKIAHMYENGSIILYLTGEGKDKGKAARLKIQTTAQGHPQTLKVAKLIQKLLEIS
jgi:putative CRISPR-associated protein (TIGR02619 family)